MEKNRFIESRLLVLLNTFSKEEWKQFKLFVRSPIFNTNPKCVELLMLLAEYAPDFEAKKLEKETIFKKIFPNEVLYKPKGENPILRTTMSRLLSLAKEFLVFQQYQGKKKKKSTKPMQHYFLLLEDLQSRRGTIKLFKDVAKKATKTLHEKRFRDEEFYKNQYHLQALQYNQYSRHKKQAMPMNLATVLTTFDTYYFINKLYSYCAAITKAHTSNIEYPPLFFDKLLAEVAQLPLKEIPAVALYYHTLLMFHHMDEEAYYQQFRQCLDNVVNILPSQDLTQIYTLATNYFLGKQTTANRQYQIQAFGLYQDMEQKGYLLNKGYISTIKMKNIVKLGLQVGEFEWVAWFIQDYKDKVPTQFQESVYNFNMAAWHFAKKNYATAHSLLLQVGTVNVFYEIALRHLLLKIYYELDETEALFNVKNTDIRFIQQNKKLPKKRKDADIAFIRKTVGLCRIKHNLPTGRSKSLTVLLDEIHHQKSLSERQWLLEKANEEVKKVASKKSKHS